jgi:RNA polymerase sigma-70 factor (ECF subfamily)
LEEKSLIEGLQRGEEKAFQELVDVFQGRILNTCLGFFPNREDAEDLTQDVFLKVFRAILGFRGDSKLSTWIYQVAVSVCLEEKRKRGRKKRLAFLIPLVGQDERELPVSSYFDHPGVQLENKERARILFEKIDELPENQRTAFVLHKVEGLKHEEIAAIMESSVSAVESLIHRAKKNLQTRLEAYYRKELL